MKEGKIMKQSNIEVSICCITYNQGKYIKEAIDSFLHQKTNFNYEIVIHDDASTDNTINKLKEYKKNFPEKIVLILEKENQYSKRPNSVLDIVFKKARGKYIAVCEGDDGFIDELKLQKQYDCMENGNFSFCSHNTEDRDENGNLIKREEKCQKNIITIEDFLNGKGNMHTSSLFFRKKDVMNMPEFYKKAKIGDLPLKLYLLSKGEAYYLNEFCSFYRHNSINSWTIKGKQNIEKKRENIESVISIYKDFDNYSNHKYNALIDKIIKRIEFEFYKSTADLKMIKKNKYKDLYKSLSIIEKIKIRLKSIKWFYRLYVKIRYGK